MIFDAIYCNILKYTRDILRIHILYAIFSVFIQNLTHFAHWSSCLNTTIGTFEWQQLSFSLYHNHIFFTICVLGRNAQYYYIRGVSVTSLNTDFFDSPFSSRWKRRKRGWQIETRHLASFFSSFTANVICCIVMRWVQTTPSDRHSCNRFILPTFRHGMHSYRAKAKSNIQSY